jgi:hypothetical protein
MFFTKRRRGWFTGWLIGALLFMQFATAAYACPQLAEQVQAAAAMADMPGCTGHMAAAMDPDQPQLCHAHCQPASHLGYPGDGADLQPPPMLLALLFWNVVATVPPLPAQLLAGEPAGAPPPGAPPLYLSLLVLRN